MISEVIAVMDNAILEVRESHFGAWVYGRDSGGMSAVQVDKQQAVKVCIAIAQAAGVERDLSQALGFEL